MVCDRIVRLVLGDVALEFEEDCGRQEDEEKEKCERARGQWI